MSFELPFKLPTGWQVATVDELVKQKIIAKPLDGNHGGIHPKASDYIESGVPFVMASDLAGGRVDLIDCKFISEEQASGLRKGIAKAGDVLLSHKATIGRTAIVQDSKHDFIMLTPQVTYYRVINSSALSNIYLKAYFDSRFFQSILGLWAGAGSTRAYLGITGQLKLPIILPPIEIQNEISGQVHALNKKVNLNNEINQTLEEMAQTIFKSWFVDFDPVKAKMNGDQPEGMDAATASLFPEKLVESELGLTPEGWNLSEIGDEVTVVGGGTPSKKNDDFWVDGHIHWTSPKDLSGVQDKVLLDTASKLTEAGLKKVSSGLLPVDTVLLSSRAPVGYLALAKVPLAVNQGYIAMKCEKVLPPEFVLQWCVHRMDEIKQRASGSTFAEISKKNFKPISVVVPSEEVLIAYKKLVKPLYDAITSNVRQSEQLSTLRDTLLPKLLSGAVTISE
ncbi:restriction endonuclease subunit S [Vibrio cholerae]|nr:restriction endonuclease subunit S [Vibrio cholerae]ELJ8749759.1 restriction endonuclease subunit S [Vibrio cholerae]